MDDLKQEEGMPRIESRSRRLLAYLQHNWPQMIADAAILATWLLVTTAVFRWFALPQWLLYVVVFIGVVVYARITPPWQRPYRSPNS